MEESLQTLGRNIRRLRKAKGTKLLEFEVLTGFDMADISRIERGEVNITFTKLVKIAEVLNVQLNDLYEVKKL